MHAYFKVCHTLFVTQFFFIFLFSLSFCYYLLTEKDNERVDLKVNDIFHWITISFMIWDLKDLFRCRYFQLSIGFLVCVWYENVSSTYQVLWNIKIKKIEEEKTHNFFFCVNLKYYFLKSFKTQLSWKRKYEAIF